MPSTEKKCSQCRQIKPLSDFHLCRRYSDGHQGMCKECKKIVPNNDPVTEGSKACSKCKQIKSVSSFDVRRASPDGRAYVCKSCKSLIEKSRGRKKPSQWAKRHPDRQRESRRRWRENNVELARKCSRDHARRAWRSKPELRERVKRYGREHPEHWQNYRARKKAAGGSISRDDIQAIFLEQNGQCRYCGDELNGNWHIEHMNPLSRGGSNDKGNIALSCPDCNRMKGRLTVEEFLARKS